MRVDMYVCLECRIGRLQPVGSSLVCDHCGATYPLREGIPILLPLAGDRRSVLRHARCSVDDLQRLYDRAYDHDGLMGTDLDTTYDRQTKERLIAYAQLGNGSRVLDLGGGIGRLWDYAAPEIVLDAYGVDLSWVAGKKALTHHPELSISVASAEFLPFADGYFDAVIAADTLEHTFDPDAALAEVCRVIKPGGMLAASFPIPNSLRKWGWNRLVAQRAGLRFALKLAKVVLKRLLLFGAADFQPIDRDETLADWVRRLGRAHFEVVQSSAWPTAPELPIVNLVSARRLAP